MITLRTHNILDYVIGAILVLCPYLFGFSTIDSARNVFLVLGFGLIGYSLITNYRYSVAKIIPLGVHMGFDVASGIFLMVAPSVFGYQELLTPEAYVLHFVMGFGAIALVMITRTKSEKQAIGSDRVDIRKAA